MNFIGKTILRFYSLFVKKSNDYILFESGNNYHDNAYSLYLYIKEHYPQYKFKYLVTSKEMKANGPKAGVSIKDTINIKQKFKLYKYSLKSKCIFFSYGNFWKKLKLKNKTKVVYVTHGEFPIKDCSEYYNYLFSNQENKLDIIMATKNIFDILSKKYPVINNHNQIVYGAPRNDVMFHPSFDKVKFLNSIGLSEYNNQKIIISMTTFRKENCEGLSYFKDEYPVSLSDEELGKLNELLKSLNTVLLIKLHPMQSKVLIPQGLSNIAFINQKQLEENNVNLNELYGVCDYMITDYSSAYISFLCLDRKLGFILTDKEKYTKDRGLTIDNIESIMPGDKMYRKEELFDFFKKLLSREDPFKAERQQIKSLYAGDYLDHNCQDIAEHYLGTKKEA